MLGLWPGVVESASTADASRVLLPVQGGCMSTVGARTSSLLACTGTGSWQKVVLSSNTKMVTAFNGTAMDLASNRLVGW